MSRQHDLITQAMTISPQVQADRVNNLVVMFQILHGLPMRFADLAEFMKTTRNVTLARSTWHLLRSPEHQVVKLDLVTGIATYFGVDERFLAWEDAASSPDYVRLHLEIEAFRAAETADAMLTLLAAMPRHMHTAVFDEVQRRLTM